MVLDIITQTDFAGAIDETYHCPGAAKLAGLIRQIREQNPNGTIFLDAGDVLCGAPIYNLTDGAPVIDVMNLMGVDAMTLGNHDFDNDKPENRWAVSITLDHSTPIGKEMACVSLLQTISQWAATII